MFEDNGIFVTRVLAAAKVIPATRGYETLAKARRSIALTCTEIYTTTGIMVGRYVCGKPQDEHFGKDKAENLRDILARLRQLVREAFPAFGDDGCLASIVVPAPPLSLELPKPQDLPSPAVPPTAVPKRGVSALLPPLCLP